MSTPRDNDTIDITRYAEVVAHLRYFPADKKDEIIARLGIRKRDWEAAAAKWTRARDAERSSGKLDVSARFGRVMAETRERLSMTRPSIESLGPLPGPNRSGDIAAPLESTLARRDAAIEAPPAAIDSAIAQQPIAPQGDSESRWARAVDRKALASTEDVDMSALLREMMPFVKGAPSPQLFAAADAARAEQRTRPAASGRETVALPVMGELSATGGEQGDRATMVLPPGPFSEPAAPTTPPTAPRDASAPPGDSGSHWARLVGTKALASTEDIDMSELRSALLPFVKGGPSPDLFAAADASRAEQGKRPASGHETISLPVTSGPSLAATLELPAQHRGPSSSLTLEQYAALHAELSLFPEKRASVLERYKLEAPGALHAIDEQFARWFDGEPAARERWRALVTHYCEWFRRRGAASR